MFLMYATTTSPLALYIRNILRHRAGESTIKGRIERDAVQPEITTIRKLAAALDVRIADLLGD